MSNRVKVSSAFIAVFVALAVAVIFLPRSRPALRGEAATPGRPRQRAMPHVAIPIV